MTQQKPQEEAHAHYRQGNALRQQRRLAEALQSYDRAISSDPQQADFHLNRGNTLRDLRRLEEALSAYDRAIALKPTADAWNNKGATLRDLRRGQEALECYAKAIAANPAAPNPYQNRGNLLREAGRLEEAVRDYAKALELKPDFDFLEGLLLHTKMHLCDWQGYEAATAALREKAGRGLPVAIPWPLLALPSSPAEQLACAKTFAARQYPAMPALWQGEKYTHNKIRISYLSADFHDHATAQLLAGVLEAHDRSRFEVTALSFGPNERSLMRGRLINAVDAFIDITGRSDDEAARLIRERETDILVDLKGFTQSARTGILARRPAPVQVNFLGYPGTMGAPYFDYIIADDTIIPPAHDAFYSEKIVRLPHCYQPNDHKRPIAPETPARNAHGLPDKAFVFCAFNNAFKITPDVFDVWMRLLQSVQGSVLWLMESSPATSANLRREAQSRGVEPAHLVFAPRLKPPDHLARHRHADLFLDTLPYNAHTTASDALWAGLPVLTCIGDTFAGRVASSTLKAVGLPELVTQSLKEYETLAAKLAHEPQTLAVLRAKLAKNRDACALFDTASYARHLEAVFFKIAN